METYRVCTAEWKILFRVGTLEVQLMMIFLPMVSATDLGVLNPPSAFHSTYQPGEVLLGALVSQCFFIASLKDFTEQPLETEDFL